MKRSAISLLTAATFAALLFAAGCSDDSDGPAENAGEAIDEAVEDAGEAVDEAVENTGEAVEKAGDKVEDATD